MEDISAQDRLIVALDFEFKQEAMDIVDQLGSDQKHYKIGSQMYTLIGPQLLTTLLWGMHKKIFLDLKYHDNPSTVGKAVSVAANYGVHEISVHAACGVRALRNAVRNKGDSKILAVTTLTGFTPDDCYKIYGCSPAQQTFKFTLMAVEAGVDGVICAPTELELGMLSSDHRFNDLIKLSAGIRLEGQDTHDQIRIATPYQAIKRGADYIVMGRPITQSGCPKIVVDQAVNQIRLARDTM